MRPVPRTNPRRWRGNELNQRAPDRLVSPRAAKAIAAVMACRNADESSAACRGASRPRPPWPAKPRRYALFTLVGIAGEDDLDAPDLCDGPRSPAPPADERSLKPGHGQPPVQQRKPGNGQRRYGMHGERPSTLEPEQSAALREKLLTAVGNITSADNAAIWAREALAAKNRLAAADAKLVEDAFEHRLSELAPSATAEAADDAAPSYSC